MPATEQVILVDKNDNPIGIAEKLEAHQKNLCHRAFSVFILRQNPSLQVLLQQRASHKYHSPLLWTNTCCSHPRPDEDILAAGGRRLKEEMGLAIPLRNMGYFHYIAHFNNGLTENEVDHVLVGFLTDEKITPNPDEVASYRWVNVEDLDAELNRTPEFFTPWLKPAWEVAKDVLLTVV